MRSLTMTSKKLVRLSNSLSPNGLWLVANLVPPIFSRFLHPFLVKHFIDIDRLLNSSLLRTRLVNVFFKEQFSVGFVIVVYYRFLVCWWLHSKPFLFILQHKIKIFFIFFFNKVMSVYIRMRNGNLLVGVKQKCFTH